ncbi:MAG: protein-tyrosine-phosphatase [Rhodothermales bacterium]|jgi:protein-tyrosine-phosphatase
MHIIFVCTGNTCRSPMAEAYFRQLIADTDILVSSAGTSAWPGSEPSESSLAVLMSEGIDSSDLRSSQFGEEHLDADRIYTMTGGHRDVLVGAFPELADRVKTLIPDADVHDPFGGDLAEYQACFANMRPALDALAKEFCNG